MANYASSTQFYARFGQTNCEEFADLEGTGSENVQIAVRINDALTVATAIVNARMANSSLSHRFPISGTAPTLIMEITRTFAMYLLTIAKGCRDYDEDGNPINAYYVLYKHALGLLEEAATGTLVLEFTT